MVSTITFAKGALSVTVHVNSISDGLKNSLIVLPTKIVSQNQQDIVSNTSGATKIGDLQDIKRTFMIKGYILSNSDKNKLISINLGAGVNTGAPVTMTYADGQVSRTSAGSDSSFTGYFDSMLITQEASDEPSSPPDDFAKFIVQITFLEGVKLAGV